MSMTNALGPSDTCPDCGQVRGYFHDLPGKCAGAPTPEPERSNIVPFRQPAAGIHPYAEGIRRAWLARLDDLRSRAWQHGDAWDQNCFVTARKLIELANSPWSGYDHTTARSDYMAHAPHDHAWDKREKCWDQAIERAGSNTLPEPEPGAALPPVTLLDEPDTAAAPIPDLDADTERDFWHARPILTHLHDFARARRVSPWAVLGVALARIITATPPQVCLPPIIGGKASLNLFVGLVGPSGSGKGAAEAVAADALSTGYITSHNVGSGEGIAHGFMHRTRNGLEWNDEAHAVLFSVPEIDSLAAQGDRRGATLMPQLRSGWTGEQLGFGYADPTKRIIVPGHEYRLCLVAGIQPGRAACLLDDADGGTPQRFLWMPATDPDAPDRAPEEPEPLVWSAPTIGGLVGIGGVKIDVCYTAKEAIVANRLARVRGQGDALDGHALLAQLKTAAALGVAESRYSVTDEDWQLAEVIARKSAATRAAVAHFLRAKAHEANHAKGEAEATRAVVVAEKVADAAVQRVCSTLVRRLRSAGESIGRAELRRSLASRDRQHFEEALERLLRAGQLVIEEGVHGEKCSLTDK